LHTLLAVVAGFAGATAAPDSFLVAGFFDVVAGFFVVVTGFLVVVVGFLVVVAGLAVVVDFFVDWPEVKAAAEMSASAKMAWRWRSIL